jgi:hypothetical protein
VKLTVGEVDYGVGRSGDHEAARHPMELGHVRPVPTRKLRGQEMERRILEERFSMPLDDVIAALGREVYGPPLGMLPPSPRECIEAALRWVERERGEICRKLWGDDRCAAFLRGDTQYQLLEMCAIVFDVLRTVLSEPTCGWAAIYLTRAGLNRICPHTSENVN